MVTCGMGTAGVPRGLTPQQENHEKIQGSLVFWASWRPSSPPPPTESVTSCDRVSEKENKFPLPPLALTPPPPLGMVESGPKDPGQEPAVSANKNYICKQ